MQEGSDKKEASIIALMQDLRRVIGEEDVQDISQELEYSFKQAADHLYAHKIINRSRNAATNPIGGSSKSRPGTSSGPSVKCRNVDNGSSNKQQKKKLTPGKKRGGQPNKGRQSPKMNKQNLQHQLQDLTFAVQKLQKKWM